MICGQTRVPGVWVSQVARRYGVNANLVFTWLRDPYRSAVDLCPRRTPLGWNGTARSLVSLLGRPERPESEGSHHPLSRLDACRRLCWARDLYRTGAIRGVACMAHVWRRFVDIHRSQGSPIAEETIGRIAQLYSVEKEARGSPPDRRAELRRTHAALVFDDLGRWLAMQLTTISGKSPLAAAIRYALTRMERLRPYLDNGILELENNAAERGMRAIALGRKNYLFVASEAGGKAAAIAYTLIETAKLNAIDPHAWRADTLARIPDYKITKVDELLPW